MDAIKNWLKQHYVGLTAGVIAVIALSVAVKSCDGNEAIDARVNGVEAKIDTLGMVQENMIEVLNAHDNKISNNLREINTLKTRMNAAEDSIASLSARVNKVQKRQEQCGCTDTKPAAKKQVQKSTSKSTQQKTNKPVQKTSCSDVPAQGKFDTVIAAVKATPMQQANGCGNDQNVNLMFSGTGNNVTISNGGAQHSVDTVMPRTSAQQCPARSGNDTVVAVVKEMSMQQANGCGDDQNANVVISGNHNTVTITNNGGQRSGDANQTATRRVVATAESTLVVNTFVTRQSYCR